MILSYPLILADAWVVVFLLRRSPILGPVVASRATQLGLPTVKNGSAGSVRGFAEVADRKTIDEIHRKEGVQPGTHRGTCPHAAAGIAAAKKAQEMATQAGHAAQVEQTTSFESATTIDNATTAANAAMRMNSANPLFDYGGFYAEELDKKHRDKSYRCVRASLIRYFDG